MIRKPTVEDNYLIQSCINILPQCTENYPKKTIMVESLHPETDVVLKLLTFEKKQLKTVLPDVFNYSWECIQIEEFNYLKIVRC